MESNKRQHPHPEHLVPAGRYAALEEELARAFYDLVEKHKAAWGLEGATPATVLRLAFEVAPPGTAGGEPGRALGEQLKRAAEHLVRGLGSFPPGHVYCHWCRSFECGHSRPPDPRSVFGGYTPTGQPLWPDYASVLLERRDPRIESLFKDPPEPVTVVQMGGELGRAQLATYGKRSAIYRILGQVLVGYLPVNREPRNGRSLLALTLQAVATSDRASRVALNVLGSLPDGTFAHEVVEEATEARLADALQSARTRLGEIALMQATSRRQRTERNKRLFRALNHLGRNVERIFRQGRRRTRHSRDRHLDRERPAASALGDALRAEPEAIYRDVVEGTWVVVGPRNRVHFFNDDGLHVTSVVYPGEAIRHRTRRGKWLHAGAARAAAFKEALERRAEPER